MTDTELLAAMASNRQTWTAGELMRLVGGTRDDITSRLVRLHDQGRVLRYGGIHPNDRVCWGPDMRARA